MRFSALAFMKDKYRNRLDAEHPMRLALSNVEPRSQKLVEAKWRWFLCFCIYLGGSQLFLQMGFLNNFGSQKKKVEKHCLNV